MSDNPKQVDVASVLQLEQRTFFTEIRKLKFAPKTYEKYTELLRVFKVENAPSSHALLLREQTRAINDKNLQKVINGLEDFLDKVPEEFKPICEPTFIEAVQKVELFCQKNILLFQKMTSLIERLIATVPERTLSPYHAIYAHLIFALKDYNNGVFMYSSKFESVQKTMTPQTLQLFLYYVGCLAMFKRELRLALFYFTECVEVPCKELTPACVGAYKKGSLIHLIVKRSPFKFSNSTLSAFSEIYKELAVYRLITEHFSSGLEKIKFHIEAYEKVLRADGNFGLSQQVMVAYIYAGVEKVSKAFSCIPIDQLARRIHIDSSSTKKIINVMAKEKLINATFKQDIVTFLPAQVNDNGVDKLIAYLKHCENIYVITKEHLTKREEEEANKKSKKTEQKDKATH
ncbi:COP9 signalosome complex subunit 3 [Entamoeba marina]